MDTERPLTLVGEEQLLDELLRLAAAAGCELERVADPVAARRRWAAAPLVLLDGAAVESCLAAGLPRRPGVLVVRAGEPGPDDWRRAVAVGAEQVVVLPAGETWLTSTLADAVDRPSATEGTLCAVLGGRGGAGASVLAAALALTALRRGADTLLVDCDPLSGGLDLLLRAENEPGLRWPELRVRGGRVAASALRSALPGRSHGSARLTVLSGSRAGPGPEPAALAAVLAAGRRSGATVVCDLPRARTDTVDVVLDRADLTVLVVPAEVRACAGAGQVAAALRDRGVRPSVVVRDPGAGGLRAADLCAALELPLLGAMRSEPGLDVALERGALAPRPRGPLATTAGTVLDALPAMAVHSGGSS